MNILGIETSCDETAVCILDANGTLDAPAFKVLGNSLYSQTKIHEQYGGVFPMMAKREHAANLVPLLVQALKEAGFDMQTKTSLFTEQKKEVIQKTLERETGLYEAFIAQLSHIQKPKIDYIAVTFGPGLEPALWVGINFAKALGELWEVPVIPINHMEGHTVSVLFEQTQNRTTEEIKFPALVALLSGGHTELVVMKDWLKYEIIGETRDDAIGEAFDKVARMLGLPYPGGPHISKLASEDRLLNNESKWKLPRPMIHTTDFDFSFSGLKTAVLYTLKKLPEVTVNVQHEIAREFEDAVTDVIETKVRNAIQKFEIKTLIIGGGVSANKNIRERLALVAKEMDCSIHLPTPQLSTDNAIMIAIASYVRIIKKEETSEVIRSFKAEGNAKIA